MITDAEKTVYLMLHDWSVPSHYDTSDTEFQWVCNDWMLPISLEQAWAWQREDDLGEGFGLET